MGQRNLSRALHAAAADQSFERRAVVRRAERRPRDQRRARAQGTGHRMHARHLQRLLAGQRRQDARQAPGRHGLATARRAEQQRVVAPGRGDLQRPLQPVLAAQVGEVPVSRYGGRCVRRGVAASSPCSRPCLRARLAERLDRFGERIDAHDRPPAQRLRLRQVAARHHEAFDAALQPAADRGQHAVHGADVAAQGQLAEHHDPHLIVPGDLTRGGDHAQRQRQVEGGARLGDRGRRQVDQDAVVRKRQAAVADRDADAVACFAHRTAGQTDDVHHRHPAPDVHLRGHQNAVHADRGVAGHTRQHLSLSSGRRVARLPS